MVLAVIRIAGRAAVKKDIEETLERMRLGKKLSCVLIDEDDKIKIGMIGKARDFIAWGKISDDTAKKMEGRKKKNKNGKEYFTLHPPRGGFKKSTKVRYDSGKGILGKWPEKELDKLIERML